MARLAGRRRKHSGVLYTEIEISGVGFVFFWLRQTGMLAILGRAFCFGVFTKTFIMKWPYWPEGGGACKVSHSLPLPCQGRVVPREICQLVGGGDSVRSPASRLRLVW